MIVGVLTRILLDVFGAILIVAYLLLLVYLCEKLMGFLTPFWEFIVEKTCNFFGFYKEKP